MTTTAIRQKRPTEEDRTQKITQTKNAPKINDLVHLSFCRWRTGTGTTLVMNKSMETEVALLLLPFADPHAASVAAATIISARHSQTDFGKLIVYAERGGTTRYHEKEE